MFSQFSLWAESRDFSRTPTSVVYHRRARFLHCRNCHRVDRCTPQCVAIHASRLTELRIVRIATQPYRHGYESYLVLY